MHTIELFLSNMAYLTIICLSIEAWFRLRQQRQDILGIKKVLARTFVVTMGEHLSNSFDRLNDMKECLQELIADERYEDAKRLKAVIDEQEQLAKKALRTLQDEFGEGVVKIEETKIRKPATNEEEN